MIETAVVAFATFFATVGPPDVAAMFAALTADASPRLKRRIALRATLIATAILLFFAFAGELLLQSLGISLPALRIAGGILLLLIGIEMTFAISSGGTSATAEEREEAALRQDITVFPLATPLIAGPGAMGASILLMSDASGFLMQATVIAALLAVLVLTLVGMLLATHLQRFLGVTGMQVITRILGVLLTALAVQFVLDGLMESGLFGAA